MLNKIFKLASVATIGILAALPAAAQNTKIKIDSENSTARLFVASSSNPDKSINVGVARLNGDVRWNANDPAKSAFDFTVYPADESKPGLSTGKTASYSVISFKSKRVEPVGYGAVRVTGDLTVSDVERVASFDPSEAYSGPTYGPAVVHSAKHEVVFYFQPAKAADGSNQETPSNWVASSTVVGEDFPELLSAVATSDWPVYVAEENCVMPSTVGEDFSGPACTGTNANTLPRTDVQCVTPSTVGEDFSGEVCTGTPLQLASTSSIQNHNGDASHKLTANEVKIQLAVQLARREAARVGTSGQ
jgi:hypothetical protein